MVLTVIIGMKLKDTVSISLCCSADIEIWLLGQARPFFLLLGTLVLLDL